MNKDNIITGLVAGSIIVCGGIMCIFGWRAMHPEIYEKPRNNNESTTNKIAEFDDNNIEENTFANTLDINESSTDQDEEPIITTSEETEEADDSENNDVSTVTSDNHEDYSDLPADETPASLPGITGYNADDVNSFIAMLNEKYPSGPGWYLNPDQTQMSEENIGYFDIPMGESEVYGTLHGASDTDLVECIAYRFYSMQDPNARVWIVVSPDGRALLEYAGELPSGDLTSFDERIR